MILHPLQSADVIASSGRGRSLREGQGLDWEALVCPQAMQSGNPGARLCQGAGEPGEGK